MNFRRFSPALLMTVSCSWFGDDLPPRTRCHEAGRIPFEELRPVGADEGGDSVWIRGTVPGMVEGQVRFHEKVGNQLTLICLGVVCDEHFEVEAPSFSAEPIHISVVELANGEAIEASHRWGALETPVPLQGEDRQVQIHIGDVAAWTEQLEVRPDRIARLEDVFHREEAPPP